MVLPDAGEPVSNESECGHEEDKDGSAIFRVSIDLPGYPNQT